jgi:aminobenzoyl-glutamate transport protein
VSEGARPGLLDRIERAGNALPDPTTLFALGAVLVLFGSETASRLDWRVEKTVTRVVTEVVVDGSGAPILDPDSGVPFERALRDDQGRVLRERVREEVRAQSLLSSDGLYWIFRSLVKNFTEFPPLGVVLVGMLGIGVAERTGFIGAALKATLLAVPGALLTPTVFFVGVMSSMGLDAGYVVLPPVAAALYHAVGRSPLVGLAAVFAGVAAGFSANLLPTSLDPLLGELSTSAARLIDPDYAVAATANWGFMVASTLLITGVGWGVWAVVAAVLALGLFGLATVVPGAPLHGEDGPFPRWVRVIVPVLFLGFLLPGAVYGFLTGSLRSDRDVARMMSETMSAMGSYVVLAFFAGQFIAWFAHSGLGEMLALEGGRALASAAVGPTLLMVAFIGVVGVGNLFIGSMSAKYAFFAPVFVPMFMQVGVSPELTQAAYRVGDSVTNVITPLNPYIVIILVFMQRYAPKAGIGTLVALMLPYALAFGLFWTALLVVWMSLGLPLGPEGPLVYVPAGAP